MNRSTGAFVTLLACVLAGTGCATVQKILLTTAWHQARVQNEGYSLLYQLMSQESDAAKLLIIKHADPPVADLIKEVARTCTQAQKELDLFKQTDRYLSFAMPNLPQIEQKTRAAMESTETKELLFSTGKKFAVRFLFTQAEAMNYGAHLARVLHAQETDPLRQKFLTTLAAHCTSFHDRLMERLKD